MATTAIAADSDTLTAQFAAIRGATEALCAPLEVEDFVVSSMPDVSPTKWHLAHTTWFFETFVLAPHLPEYRALEPRYAFLFNSYYVQAGERHCRAQRGLVTRPTVRDVFAYRSYVNDAMTTLLDRIGHDPSHPASAVITLGIHHEQQHQELLLTDIKHVLWTNPLRPAYRSDAPAPAPATAQSWIPVAEGVHHIGHEGHGFAFDNEGPRHRVYVQSAEVARRLSTNAEYAAFIADGGYRQPALWLSAGFAAVQAERWSAPLYWELVQGAWHEFTLHGLRPLDPHAPVTHLSHYEADAFARWSGGRLPTEAEWEITAPDPSTGGRFADSGAGHPSADATDGPQQWYGDVWQWTQSAYLAYPGFRPAPGAIGEYNGKFMSDQWVLRGASCATASSHARRTYRNFFPSDARWQFTGVRLGRDVA